MPLDASEEEPPYSPGTWPLASRPSPYEASPEEVRHQLKNILATLPSGLRPVLLRVAGHPATAPSSAEVRSSSAPVTPQQRPSTASRDRLYGASSSAGARPPSAPRASAVVAAVLRRHLPQGEWADAGERGSPAAAVPAALSMDLPSTGSLSLRLSRDVAQARGGGALDPPGWGGGGGTSGLSWEGGRGGAAPSPSEPSTAGSPRAVMAGRHSGRSLSSSLPAGGAHAVLRSQRATKGRPRSALQYGADDRARPMSSPRSRSPRKASPPSRGFERSGRGLEGEAAPVVPYRPPVRPVVALIGDAASKAALTELLLASGGVRLSGPALLSTEVRANSPVGRVAGFLLNKVCVLAYFPYSSSHSRGSSSSPITSRAFPFLLTPEPASLPPFSISQGRPVPLDVPLGLLRRTVESAVPCMDPSSFFVLDSVLITDLTLEQVKKRGGESERLG